MDEAQRVGERREAARLDQLHDAKLLALGVDGRQTGRVRHAELLQHRARAREPRLAGHVGLIQRAGQPARFREARQRLPPGPLMGGIDDHAVHVENDAAERPATAGLGLC